MTEEVMLHGCLNNIALAQEALYNRFSPRMLGVCYRFARNREDAEDMLQEGFIKVSNKDISILDEQNLIGLTKDIDE